MGIISEYPNLIRCTVHDVNQEQIRSLHTVPRLLKNVFPGMQAAETRALANLSTLTRWYSCQRARSEVEEMEQSSGVQ